MRVTAILSVALALVIGLLTPKEGRAERATPEEMKLV